MAREVCIKTSTGTYCTGSPIRDCTCKRNSFEDPFPEVPERITDAESFMNDLRAVLMAAGKVPKDPEEFAECFGAIAAVTRLVLLPQVTLKGEAFIIMAMTPEP